MAGDVRVVLKSVFDDTGIKNAQKQLQNIGAGIDKAFKVAGTAVAAAGVALGAFAKSSVDAASDLAESTNAVNVAYGAAADAILAIGENSASSLGLAKNEFNSAAVRFSAFAERVVGQGGDVSVFVKDVTQRAADFASVFNIEVSEALQVFQSGLAGEAEPLKRFGINLLDSEVKAYALRAGIIKVGETMTETQKVQARYGLLMESTNKTAGDFANTSDGLANSQRILKAQFTDLQAEIGTALLPVVTDLVKQFANYLLPKMKEIGAFLQSPQGKKAIEDLATAFGKAFDAVFDFLDYVIKNWETITKFFSAIFAGMAVIRTFIGVMGLARTAIQLFGLATAATPIGALILALGLATAAAIAFTKVTTEEEKAQKKVTNSVMKLRQEQIQLTEKIKQGGIEVNTYKKKLQEVNTKLAQVESSAKGTAGEINRFNKLRLDGAIASMNAYKNATSLAERQARSFAESYSYLESIGAVTKKTTGTTTPDTVIDTGPSAADIKKQINETIRESIDAIDEAKKAYRTALTEAKNTYIKTVQDINKTFSDTLKRATKDRNDALAKASEDNARAIEQIQKTYSDKLDDIITQSISRLRDAYRGAVAVDIGKLFATEEVAKSVDGLVKSLSNKLTASRKLLANSAALASAGFSQTFIEQVVSAGTETGNELAQSILEATPETQNELKGLFRALETESETGMDALSQTIYDKAGLATDALVTLYSNTQKELTKALADQELTYSEAQKNIQLAFEETMTAAAIARDEALSEALSDYKDAATKAAQEFLDDLDRIGKEYSKKLAELGAKQASIQALENRIASAASIVKPIEIPVVPQITDPITELPFTPEAIAPIIAPVTQIDTQAINAIQELIDGANRYIGNIADPIKQAGAQVKVDIYEQIQSALEAGAQIDTSGIVSGLSSAELAARATAATAGTNITINVKTDATQSNAMVGKTIGSVVSKYVGTGGSVLVSGIA